MAIQINYALTGFITLSLAYNPILNLNSACVEIEGNNSCQSLHPETSEWTSLINTAVEVIKIQHNLTEQSYDLSSSLLYVVLNDQSLWRPVLSFIDTISSLLPGAQILHFSLTNASFHQEISKIIHDVMANELYINTVVIISSDLAQITHFLRTVSRAHELKWTSVIHVTEWVIISPLSNLQSVIQTKHYTFDYVTLVYSLNQSVITVAQKSRTYGFKIVAQSSAETTECITRGVDLNSSLSQDVKQSGCVMCPRRIRAHPLLHLSSEKSDVAGLSLPIAFPENAYVRTVSFIKVGNTTVYDGFSIAVAKLFADAVGFELDYVSVTDGGDYGEALQNKTATGITGKLARREAAMAALVSRLENRESVIDFLPNVLMEESANIVYRLPATMETLDITYITIFKPEFLLSLVGPLVLIALTAVFVHFLTTSCTVVRPRIPTVLEARDLIEFTENICFQHRREYIGQTSRILRASWSVFTLILLAAYSSYLTTTFAVKPEELKIRSFTELLSQKDFSFGMHGSGKALPIILKTSSDKNLREVWDRLVGFNKTNPLTFSLDMLEHVRQIMNGHYAFLDNFSIGSGEFYDYIPDDVTDIRAYPQNSLQGLTTSYIAIPKHVFYKDEFYKFHLNLDASGIVQKLQSVYFSKKGKINASKANTNTTAVDIDRIKLVIYAAVVGIGLSFTCLAAECAVMWWRNRKLA